jgi:hypothetical protein
MPEIEFNREWRQWKKGDRVSLGRGVADIYVRLRVAAYVGDDGKLITDPSHTAASAPAGDEAPTQEASSTTETDELGRMKHGELVESAKLIGITENFRGKTAQYVADRIRKHIKETGNAANEPI